MVVICAGTTGYNATVDLRYLWMRQKRLQGSHFANDDQAQGFNELVLSGEVDPCMSKAVVYDELPQVHQLMHENKHPHGNMAVLIGAAGFGQGVHRPDLRRGVATTPTHDDWDGARGIPDVIQDEDSQIMSAVTKNVTVANVMHAGLVSCRPDTPVGEVSKTLVDKHIHAVIVLDTDDRPIGIVSQTDIVMASQAKTRAELLKVQAKDVMTQGCITCDVSSSLSDAIALMVRSKIHRMVVTDKQASGQKAVGLISMTDILAQYVVGK